MYEKEINVKMEIVQERWASRQRVRRMKNAGRMLFMFSTWGERREGPERGERRTRKKRKEEKMRRGDECVLSD